MRLEYICDSCKKEIKGKVIVYKGRHYDENCWKEVKLEEERKLNG